MKQTVSLLHTSYPIYIEAHLLENIHKYIDTNKKFCIVTDTGIPSQWIYTIQKQFPNHFVCTIKQGEFSKNINTWQHIIKELIAHDMTRKDAILAIGGGMITDLAGFVASSYMRGIAFYNIPTTLLAQIDASVGGKVALDIDGYKNIIGAFYHPKAVFIDPFVLTTLSKRHLHNGLMEALKCGLIHDSTLFSLFQQDTLNIEQIIQRSIQVKKEIVEADEKESGLRKILNFGHTIGHAIESNTSFHTYLHGECVAMGMLFFIEDSILKKQVLAIYKKLNIPRIPSYNPEDLLNYIRHDKKSNTEGIEVVKVNKCGSCYLETLSLQQIMHILKGDPYEE